MAKFELKIQASILRKKGKSLREIMSALNISKSTASLWCRDIKLSKEQQDYLHNKMISKGYEGRIQGALKNKMKKLESQKKARREAEEMLQDISLRDRIISGIALYWAGGSKAPSTSGFLFVNSDPAMIYFMYDWLVNIMKVSKIDIHPMISINHIHRHRAEKVLSFWSNLLDLPRNQFANIFFIKSVQKKVYDNHENHFGVLRLGVRRSTFLRYKVLALVDMLKAGVAQVVRANAS